MKKGIIFISARYQDVVGHVIGKIHQAVYVKGQDREHAVVVFVEAEDAEGLASVAKDLAKKIGIDVSLWFEVTKGYKIFMASTKLETSHATKIWSEDPRNNGVYFYRHENVTYIVGLAVNGRKETIAGGQYRVVDMASKMDCFDLHFMEAARG